MNIYHSIYIQAKKPIEIHNKNVLVAKDLVDIVADKEIKEDIENIKIIDIADKKKDHIVISVISIINRIRSIYPNIIINVIGEDEILLKINKLQRKNNILFETIKVIVVCSILFFGAGLAINHFHADVDMGKAHSEIYKLITGEEKDKPILLQVAYSIGLGIGMLVFFYRISPRLSSDEPNPLDMELYLYEQNVEQYILDKEKRK